MNNALNEITKFFMGPNNQLLPVRIPAELFELLNKKAEESSLKLPNYIRDVLNEAVIKEILWKALNTQATNWLSQEGQKSIELHFGKKIKDMQQIITAAQLVIDETNKLQDEFIKAETAYLNKINSKIEKIKKEEV